MHISAINNFSYKNYNCSGPCPEPKRTSFKGKDNGNKHFGNYGDNVQNKNPKNFVKALTLAAAMGLPVIAVIPTGCTKELNVNQHQETHIPITFGCDTCDRVDPDTAWFISPVMHARNQLFDRLGIDTTGGHVIKDLSYTNEMDYYHVKDTFNSAQSAKERLVYDRTKYEFNDETGYYDKPVGKSEMVYTLTEGGLLKAAEYVVDSTGDEHRVDTKFYRYDSSTEAGVPVYGSLGTAARIYTLEPGPDGSIIHVVLPSGTTHNLSSVETNNDEVQLAK